MSSCYNVSQLFEKRVTSRLNAYTVYLPLPSAEDVCKVLSYKLQLTSPVVSSSSSDSSGGGSRSNNNNNSNNNSKSSNAGNSSNVSDQIQLYNRSVIQLFGEVGSLYSSATQDEDEDEDGLPRAASSSTIGHNSSSSSSSSSSVCDESE